MSDEPTPTGEHGGNGSGWLSSRPTADLVVMLLAGLIVFIVVASLLAVVIIGVTRPSADLNSESNALADITSTLIAAVIGFIAGRGQPTNGNGKSNGTPPLP